MMGEMIAAKDAPQIGLAKEELVALDALMDHAMTFPRRPWRRKRRCDWPR
jgi:hypothetical protein